MRVVEAILIANTSPTAFNLAVANFIEKYSDDRYDLEFSLPTDFTRGSYWSVFIVVREITSLSPFAMNIPLDPDNSFDYDMVGID